MTERMDNWKTQVRRGYLELCILLLIQRYKRLYGFDLLEKLEDQGLPLKEGTLYPLLNRMAEDQYLDTQWETENLSGHPRKFYSLTARGTGLLEEMKAEFEKMILAYQSVQSRKSPRRK